MRRRKFLVLFGSAVATWPLAARAQEASGKVWRIGYLNPGPRLSLVFDAWKRKLRALGYVEGKNLVIEARFADNIIGNLPQLGRELVAANPDVLVGISTPAVSALQKATNSIPIVMGDIGDPIGSGFIASLAKPGGKITGTANMTIDYIPKTIELLRELLPEAKRAAALMSANPTHPVLYRALEAAAKVAGIELLPAMAKAEADLDAAFAAMSENKCDALIILTETPRFRIVSLAAQARLPAIYQQALYVGAGGLISYGADTVGSVEQTAVYADKIIRGADPAELPVEQPTKFEMKINLKTAKALGLTIPPTLLARADEVIE